MLRNSEVAEAGDVVWAVASASCRLGLDVCPTMCSLSSWSPCTPVL